MKISDLKRPVKEMSSGGAVGGGAIAGTAGGLGNVASTVKKQKKRRKLRDGQTVIQREAKENLDSIWKNAYREGWEDGNTKGHQDRTSRNPPEYNEPHDPRNRGRVTRENARKKAYLTGYQDGYYDAITGEPV